MILVIITGPGEMEEVLPNPAPYPIIMSNIEPPSEIPAGQKYPVLTKKWEVEWVWAPGSHSCLEVLVVSNGNEVLGPLKLFKCLQEHTSSAENKVYLILIYCGSLPTEGIALARYEGRCSLLGRDLAQSTLSGHETSSITKSCSTDFGGHLCNSNTSVWPPKRISHISSS
ncbi:hypothetical protein JB92DRAFT_2838481 [Gautieria morchelliformis]|nr:hypothetical protein JB92DRAFT_2838481 [Gautieria morchelliformis]